MERSTIFLGKTHELSIAMFNGLDLQSLPEGKSPYSYGFPMGFPMIFQYSHGFPMVSYGFPMIFQFSYFFFNGFPRETQG